MMKGMVLLNYNFIYTCEYMHGNTGYFACKMLKFAVEIKIYMRPVVEFLLDEMWNFHKTWDFRDMWLWIYMHEKSYYLHGYVD